MQLEGENVSKKRENFLEEMESSTLAEAGERIFRCPLSVCRMTRKSEGTQGGKLYLVTAREGGRGVTNTKQDTSIAFYYAEKSCNKSTCTFP